MEGPAALSLSGMGWLFAVAITLHSIEEGIWLPAFSQKKGYWRIPATVTQARLVLVLLTLFAWLCAWLVSMGSALGTYLLCGYALIMLLNVFIPHVIATIALRQYAPGTATAVLFILPVCSRLLWLAITRGIRQC
jgi:zinc transporter ZupT